MKLLKPTYPKMHVTAVTAVQAPIHADLRFNGTKTTGVTTVSVSRAGAALKRLKRHCNGVDVTLKPSIHAGCTPVTAVTAQSKEHRVKLAHLDRRGC